MYRTSVLSGEVAKQPEKKGVIVVPEKASRAIVGALPYVKRNAGDDDPGGSGHGPRTGSAPARLTGK